MAGRKDIRDWQMVTIDGEDAKDMDDAVSLTKEGGRYVLGVHIADVANYVQEGSAGPGGEKQGDERVPGRPGDPHACPTACPTGSAP